jgi:negative regulator of flagellin synthesis FlgM
MKIESSISSTPAVLQPAASRAAGNGAEQGAVGAVQETAAANASSSTVSLSTQLTANGPDIDTATVESIKAALRDGTYQIDSGKIADGMINTARDLLQPRIG